MNTRRVLIFLVIFFCTTMVNSCSLIQDKNETYCVGVCTKPLITFKILSYARVRESKLIDKCRPVLYKVIKNHHTLKRKYVPIKCSCQK